MHGMNDSVNVVVGVPTYRAGAYILDKFLANQKEIQQSYPSSELVFATNEPDFAKELEGALSHWAIKGRVLCYETIKPDYAKSRLWNIACGREAIRQYTLSETEAKYLLSLDADMTYDPNIIEIMEREIQGNDVVYSGYLLRDFGVCLAGSGCCMLTKAVVKKVKYRCVEFRNAAAISEDTLLELDLLKSGRRVKKGFFISISHYQNQEQARAVRPQSIGIYRRITHLAVMRYIIIEASLILRQDIGWKLNVLIHKILTPLKMMPSPRKTRAKREKD
jgi:hypothetical protein